MTHLQEKKNCSETSHISRNNFSVFQKYAIENEKKRKKGRINARNEWFR